MCKKCYAGCPNLKAEIDWDASPSICTCGADMDAYIGDYDEIKAGACTCNIDAEKKCSLDCEHFNSDIDWDRMVENGFCRADMDAYIGTMDEIKSGCVNCYVDD